MKCTRFVARMSGSDIRGASLRGHGNSRMSLRSCGLRRFALPFSAWKAELIVESIRIGSIFFRGLRFHK